MFEIDQPASNIVELLEYLRSEHQENDLYRGQIRDYPALVPSAFRGAVVAGSENEPMVLFDEERFWQTHTDRPQIRLRYRMMNQLVKDLGVGLGNLVSQQYGISSECVDVTDTPSIAAFFATRRWPHYAHVCQADHPGVIYRFRNLWKPFGIAGLSPRNLDELFEGGVCNGRYFDFFRLPSQLETVFQRDNWIGWHAPQEETVATLQINLSFADIIEVVEAGRREETGRATESWLKRAILKADWYTSRIAGQRGGFLRPSFFWSSDTPENPKIAHDLYQMGTTYGATLRLHKPGDIDGPLWPRVIPSLAIKKHLIGIENLRHRSGCERFYFHHRPRPVTGLYRRCLWPEPSEDNVYEWVWLRAFTHLHSVAPTAVDLPAIDDPDEGLLDRGYVVMGERKTKDARDLDDLARGQLEDAEEARQHDGLSAANAALEASALASLSRHRDAMLAAVAGLRLDRGSIDCLIALADGFHHAGKQHWCERTLAAASRIDPHHPAVLHGLAIMAIDRADYRTAATFLDTAIDRHTHLPYRFHIAFLINERASVARILGETDTLAEIERKYSTTLW